MQNPAASTVHEIVERPLTLPWLPGAQRLLITDQTFLRRNPSRSDGYELECQFSQLDGQGRRFGAPLYGWAPLEQLPLLRTGSIFEDRVFAGYREGLVTKQATRFRPKFLSELKELGVDWYQSRGEHRDDNPVASNILLAQPACVGAHDGRKIYIPSNEIMRFYFGASSLLAGTFLNAVHGEPGLGLVDFDETRFLEPGVFQIAPVSGLADRASALHLAMLLNSPDLLQMWRSAADDCLASSSDGSFQCRLMLPASSLALSLWGKTSIVQGVIGTAAERAFVVSAILSDYRPAPFSKVVIKLPHGMAEGDLDDADAEPGAQRSRFLSIIGDEARLDNRRRPGVNVARTSPHHDSLRRTFPNLSRVPIQYDTAAIARRQPREVERQKRMIEALSTLPPGSDREVGGIQFRPSRSYCAPTPLEAPTDRLFSGGEILAGLFEPIQTTDLKYPLSVFAKAMNRISQLQRGGLVAQDPLSSAHGAIMIMAANPSWSALARGRRIAIGRIEVDGQTVYAFEMSRRHPSESISLGLVAKADGSPMSITELSRVAEHATQQIGSRGSRSESRKRGVWPGPSVFLDVTGRVVTHTAKRKFPSVLAEDLEALSRSLFPPVTATQAVA